MTNLEGRVILRRAAAEPRVGVRTDLEVLSGLAARLGCPDAFPAQPEVVFEELRRASAGGAADYAGISYARVARDGGTFWPCPDTEGPDTPRLFLDRFATEDGRARFRAVTYQRPVEPPDDEYPLWFTTGRVLRHYQSGTQTRRVTALSSGEPEPFLELHPVLARRHRLITGDLVSVRSRRGEAIALARITPDIRADTVFMPFHFAGVGSVNRITNDATDPISGMPEFKVCAVDVAAVTAGSQPALEEISA